MPDLNSLILKYVSDVSVLDEFATTAPNFSPRAFKVLPGDKTQLRWIERSPNHMDTVAERTNSAAVFDVLFAKASRQKTLLALAKNPNLPQERIDELLVKVFGAEASEALKALQKRWPDQSRKAALSFVASKSEDVKFAFKVAVIESVSTEPSAKNFEIVLKFVGPGMSAPERTAILAGFTKEDSQVSTAKLWKLYKPTIPYSGAFSGRTSYEDDPRADDIVWGIAARLAKSNKKELPYLRLGPNTWSWKYSAIRYFSAHNDSKGFLTLMEAVGVGAGNRGREIEALLREWGKPFDEHIATFAVKYKLAGWYLFNTAPFTPEGAMTLLEAYVNKKIESGGCGFVTHLKDMSRVASLLEEAGERADDICRRMSVEQLRELSMHASETLKERAFSVNLFPWLVRGTDDDLIELMVRYGKYFNRDAAKKLSSEQLDAVLSRVETDDATCGSDFVLELVQKDGISSEMLEKLFRSMPEGFLAELAGDFKKLTPELVELLFAQRTHQEQRELLLAMKPTGKEEWFRPVALNLPGLLSTLSENVCAPLLASLFTEEFSSDFHLWQSALTLTKSWNGSVNDLVVAVRELT